MTKQKQNEFFSLASKQTNVYNIWLRYWPAAIWMEKHQINDNKALSTAQEHIESAIVNSIAIINFIGHV